MTPKKSKTNKTTKKKKTPEQINEKERLAELGIFSYDEEEIDEETDKSDESWRDYA